MTLSILTDAHTLRKHLENIITPQPKGRAEYTTLLEKSFSADDYQRLLYLLEELKADGSIGYRQWGRSVSIVIHKRKTQNI